MLRDPFSRTIDYLRVSVTDRCDLRCVYCMPPEGIPLKPVSEILTYDELIRTVREARNSSSSAAVTYEVPGFAGKLGIISPISRKFCSDCNRLRVTADGRLRSCLFGRETLDLRGVLRGGRGDDAVADLFRLAARTKPQGHDLCDGGDAPSAAEPMSRVGG
jgi:cyclic pyranopterin phosphate synthase